VPSIVVPRPGQPFLHFGLVPHGDRSCVVSIYARNNLPVLIQQLDRGDDVLAHGSVVGTFRLPGDTSGFVIIADRVIAVESAPSPFIIRTGNARTAAQRAVQFPAAHRRSS
jgi:hypothetical protein